jgi:hypothetical protein
VSSVTIGLELEWADVDRWTKIPPELGEWSSSDYSIVNSDGHANSPDGSTWRWGGEINTRPTASVTEQGDIVSHLAMLLNPTVNYKCNLHVHCRDSRFGAMLGDVEKLKRFFQYLQDSANFVYTVVEPLPEPRREEFGTIDEFKGALKRWRRNLDSHHHVLPGSRCSEIMNATTPQEFKDAHASPTSTGSRAWHVAKRPGMNMRSLWKHGTVEYRHFHGTVSPQKAASAARWCQLFTNEATNFAFGETSIGPRLLYETHGPFDFPQPQPYRHDLQLGFERTKHK